MSMARNKEPLRNREQLVQEIERVRKALDKTKSPNLKQQYTRHLKRMQRELDDYDRFRAGGINGESRKQRKIS